jgi:hypothetical protein
MVTNHQEQLQEGSLTHLPWIISNMEATPLWLFLPAESGCLLSCIRHQKETGFPLIFEIAQCCLSHLVSKMRKTLQFPKILDHTGAGETTSVLHVSSSLSHSKHQKPCWHLWLLSQAAGEAVVFWGVLVKGQTSGQLADNAAMKP